MTIYSRNQDSLTRLLNNILKKLAIERQNNGWYMLHIAAARKSNCNLNYKMLLHYRQIH